MSIVYVVDLLPSVFGPSAKTIETPSLNITHCFNIEYIIKKRTIVCLSEQYFKTGISQTPENTLPQSAEYIGNSKMPLAIIKGLNSSLGFKFFHSNYIAPVGKYSKIEVLGSFYTVSYDNTKFMQG